ncbi:Helix-turn-helix domain-containing protein [Pedobacter steynii]|uniref:Helix-turn-helix domain-containing protein n=2 Tax=Pedobacter steynii TaxID=430522 RepID=A0A1G9P7A5_9SPHI|nr:helix-turn-helix domain-containing protein [Pedobacter steynii]NQX39070.1 helix-turn-helix domain-containing protein [Pedobacter steynii]SDL94678.1 Helix-turn-helix domain-containing protein [Pedobacter steynii]
MILKFILQILRQILNLQTENTSTLMQIINSLKPIPVDEVWLHTEDVMKLFKKSEKTLYNWRQKGLLRYKIIGRTVYYLRSDIYQILSKE